MSLSPSTLSLFHPPSLAHSHSLSPFLSLTIPAISRSNLFFTISHSHFSLSQLLLFLYLALSLYSHLFLPPSLFSLPLPIICFLLPHIPLPIICHFSLSLTLPLSLMSFPLSDSSPAIRVLSHSQLSRISNSLSFPLISPPLPLLSPSPYNLFSAPSHSSPYNLSLFSLSDSTSLFNVFPAL